MMMATMPASPAQIPAVLGPRPANRKAEKPKKTATLLAQQIVSEIADGGLAPGAPMLSERAMLEEYGVARGSLREALRFLEIQGVISIKTGPGGGPVVERPTFRHLASTIAMLLQLTDTRFHEVVETRLQLEPPLAGKAALRATDDELAALEASVERMHDNLEDRQLFLAENETFHTTLAQAAGNHVLAMLISSLNWICDGTPLGVDFPPNARRSITREHRRIYHALADRDSERASAAMSLHLADFAAYMKRRYPQIMEMPVRWDQLV
jgi:DNA-binding FadR family transcriptional regulator